MLEHVFLESAFCTSPNKSPFYIIENVESDVTDESAVKAREKALLEGQRKALQLLLKRLSGTSTSWESKISSLKDSDISNLVADFEITQEKSSSVRYIATLTYRFKLQAINEFLANLGITPQETSTDSILVIPILKIGEREYLWEDENLWRALWQEGSLSSSNIPLRLPLGDLEDIQTLDSSQAMAFNLSALDLMAERYKTKGGAIVVVATLTPAAASQTGKESIPLNADAIEIAVLDPSLSQQEVKLPPLLAQNGSGAALETSHHLMDRALRETLRFLNTEWQQNMPRKSMASQQAEFTASFFSKSDWFRIRHALDALKNKHVIEDFLVQSLNTQTASLMILFRGDLETLKKAFQSQNLNLIHRETVGETEKTRDIQSLSSLSPLNGDSSLNAPF